LGKQLLGIEQAPSRSTFYDRTKTAPSTTLPTAQNATPSASEQGTRAIALDTGAETLQELNKLVASTTALRQAGYVLEKLAYYELENKRRCLACSVRGEF
jgi:hypothetical protein